MKMYTEKQVKLAIKKTVSEYEWIVQPSMQALEEDFLENLALTEDM